MSPGQASRLAALLVTDRRAGFSTWVQIFFHGPSPTPTILYLIYNDVVRVHGSRFGAPILDNTYRHKGPQYLAPTKAIISTTVMNADGELC